MSAADNKAAMQAAFAALAEGDGRPFFALMAQDFTWTVPGRTAWSRTYEGRDTCVAELFQPLYAQFTERQRIDALSFTAEGDLVIVECRGRPVRTVSGGIYGNEYCYVCHFAGGRLTSLREYLDTAMIDSELGPPPWAALRETAAAD
jgi:ketosteroid isomerase-like protein